MKLTLNDKTATYSIFRHDFAGSYAVLDYYRTWRRPPQTNSMESCALSVHLAPPTFYVHELKQDFPIYISINPDYVNWHQKSPLLPKDHGTLWNMCEYIEEPVAWNYANGPLSWRDTLNIR